MLFLPFKLKVQGNLCEAKRHEVPKKFTKSNFLFPCTEREKRMFIKTPSFHYLLFFAHLLDLLLDLLDFASLEASQFFAFSLLASEFEEQFFAFFFPNIVLPPIFQGNILVAIILALQKENIHTKTKKERD